MDKAVINSSTLDTLSLDVEEVDLVREIYSDDELGEDLEGDFWVSPELFQEMKERLGR